MGLGTRHVGHFLLAWGCWSGAQGFCSWWVLRVGEEDWEIGKDLGGVGKSLCGMDNAGVSGGMG